MSEELELKRGSELADARLGVAEELGWGVAVFGGCAAFLMWHGWLIAIGAAIALYIVATFRYRKAAAKAEDTYYRVAKLGKYVS